MARVNAFTTGTGRAPADATPTPAPTSGTSSYSPTAAYTSPSGFGLSQVGSAIGDTVSKYVTPAVKAVSDTYTGLDDFGRVAGKVRSGDWAGAAKSAATGAAELGTTLAGGAAIRAAGKGLAFGAGKLGKYVPALETASETGGRLITGLKRDIAAVGAAATIGFSPIVHTVGEVIKNPTSVSQAVGATPKIAKGALETVEQGAKAAVPVVEGAVKKVSSEAGEFGAKAVNVAKAALGINADAPDQAPVTTVRNYQQQQKKQQEGATTGRDTAPAPKPPAKKPVKPKKPKDFDFGGNVPGQSAQITVVN
jgi:hypothetical protein